MASPPPFFFLYSGRLSYEVAKFFFAVSFIKKQTSIFKCLVTWKTKKKKKKDLSPPTQKVLGPKDLEEMRLGDL